MRNDARGENVEERGKEDDGDMQKERRAVVVGGE